MSLFRLRDARAAGFDCFLPFVAGSRGAILARDAVALVLTVAAADEIRQSFSSERIGSLSDVILDCAGGLTAILLFRIFTLNAFKTIYIE